jgi:hypothetical protein
MGLLDGACVTSGCGEAEISATALAWTSPPTIAARALARTTEALSLMETGMMMFPRSSGRCRWSICRGLTPEMHFCWPELQALI